MELTIPSPIAIAICLFAFGRMLDFGIRRWHEGIWHFAREKLWYSIAGLTPIQLHTKVIKWLDGLLNYKEGSKEENHFMAAVLVYVFLALAFTWLLTLDGVSLINRGAYPEHLTDLYPLTVLNAVSVLALAIWTCGILYSAFMLSAKLWGGPFDRAVARGKASTRRFVRSLAIVSSQFVTGIIYGGAIGVVVLAGFATVYGLFAASLRPHVLSILSNIFFDAITFGITASLLRIAARGAALRHIVCILADLIVAVLVALLSFMAMQYIYGYHGYRWLNSGPMQGTVAALTITALIPTVCIAAIILFLIALRFSQVALRLLGLYTVDQVAHPNKDDEALPFTTLGFLAAVVVLATGFL